LSPSDKSVGDVYVARQPILAVNQAVYAYELLYRSSMENAFDGTDATTATSRVIANSYLNIGLERLVGDRCAFINFGRQLLLDGYAEMLPKDSVVVEILEDIEPDTAVVDACKALKRRGFVLALDDFVTADGYDELLGLADIVKVDFHLTDASVRDQLAEQLRPRGLRLLAEKVETHEEFEEAVGMGYTLFQGYFFSRPKIVAGKQIPGFKLNYARVLKEVGNPELDFQRIDDLVKAEASLVHQLLRYVNSASFGWKREVESIRHALALLGETEVRKWISLAALAGIASDKPQELVVEIVVRGRFCESISKCIGMGARSSEFFLLGMYSLLDALMDKPMSEVVNEVHLADDLRDVLLGRAVSTKGLRESLTIVCAYEEGDWEAIAANAASLSISQVEVSESYLEAAEWADEIFQC
jgi:EAL and modified HD-GYP domain-containing signal transduction protein